MRANDVNVVRLAVAAPRTVGNATLRNRARRRLREAFRLAIASLDAASAQDIVVTARKNAISADFSALRAAAQAALRTVHAQG